MTLSTAVRRVAGRERLVGTVAWTLVGLALVATASSAVGLDRILRAAARAERPAVVGVACLLFTALALRGLVLWTTLRAVGAPVGVVRALATYLAVSFVNTVCPGGSAGGTPIAGLVVARSARTEYEAGVTATLTVATLSNLMVGAFGAVGVVLLLATGGPGDTVATGAVGVGLFAVGLVVAVALWRVRDRTGDAVVSGATAVSAALDRRLPWALPDRATVEARARTFGEAAGRLVTGPRPQSAALLGLSAAAHVSSVLALLLALDAIDVSVSVELLFAVVPTAVLAAIAPAPGAGGGVEVALGTTLAAATGAPAAAVGAAVLIYRGSGFAFRLVVGGLALAVLLAVR